MSRYFRSAPRNSDWSKLSKKFDVIEVHDSCESAFVPKHPDGQYPTSSFLSLYRIVLEHFAQASTVVVVVVLYVYEGAAHNSSVHEYEVEAALCG